MPITPTYPGVYIEELPSAVHTIVGVSTSVTAFIGTAPKGPIDEAMLIHSFSDYGRIYGGLNKNSKMSYAVSHYFLNGGKDAVIVRVVGDNTTPATFNTPEGLQLQAANPGVWANNLKITINNNVKDDPNNPGNPDPKLFNLIVTKTVNKIDVMIEQFLNVSCYSDNERYLKTVLEEESDYLRVTQIPNPPPTPGNGTYSPSTNGSDGLFPNDSQILGYDSAGANKTPTKTGIDLLDQADFNLLCIPPFDGTAKNTTSWSVYSAALSYCQPRRAIVIVDPKDGWTRKSIMNDVKNNNDFFSGTRYDNAMLYFPRLRMSDPLQQNRPDTFVPCGAIAGVIAQTDANRGVWKAPAGIEAGLSGVMDLTVKLTDDENGDLNPLGVNCLRSLPGYGIVVWGARTMRGSDILADQWKYISIRRTAYYIEESIYRGTKWAVFEPNDEPLWSQLRLNIGSFMQDLFKKGAFQGSSPKDAYLVKCDKDTTTQTDIDKGIVNILVGFAPLYPAEFVMIQIQQLAGQQSGGA